MCVKVAKEILRADATDCFRFGITINQIVDRMYPDAVEEKKLFRQTFRVPRFAVTVRKYLAEEHCFPTLTINRWFDDEHPSWPRDDIPSDIFDRLNDKDKVVRMIAGGLSKDRICHGILFCQYVESDPVRRSRRAASILYERFMDRNDEIIDKSKAGQSKISINSRRGLLRLIHRDDVA
jgi:hypothetical protein